MVMVIVMDIENGNECFVGRWKHSQSPEILLYTHDHQKTQQVSAIKLQVLVCAWVPCSL
jgi:hypothetical protein